MSVSDFEEARQSLTDIISEYQELENQEPPEDEFWEDYIGSISK